MKTTGNIYDQHQRIYASLMNVTKMRIKRAHPETDGNSLLAHNWGNDEAKAVLKWSYEQSNKEHAVYERLYNIAEHQRHNDDFRPLWCEYCTK